MDEKYGFGLAIGLEGTPWRVTDIRLDPAARRLYIDLDFPPGSRCAHPDTGQPGPVYDALQCTRLHMNFDGGPGGGGVKPAVHGVCECLPFD